MGDIDNELPIEAYGAIGNLRGAALVGADGAVAWCCMPGMDSPSLFASLLDTQRGGCFRVAPRAAAQGKQRYLDDTNVLRTSFDTEAGVLHVTDFMPVTGVMRPDGDALYRILTADGGDIVVDMEWSPRFDYARGRGGIAAAEAGFIALGAGHRATLLGVPDDAVVDIDAEAPTLRARFTVPAGERIALRMHYGDALGPDDAEHALHATCAAWRAWARAGAPTDWAGQHAALVRRSALALKLMCDAETGGIVAAPTTSLPEAIGGERNWDYRYVWLRDAGMTIEALLGAGHGEEAAHFLRFFERASARPNRHGPWLPLVLGLHGETELQERRLDHLAGYRGSRPVRIGNGIAPHRGHDIYEQLLGAALEYAAAGHALDPSLCDFLVRAADIACAEWRHPDHGIWEVPDGPRHYVHSKWTVCCALDHALRLSKEFGIGGDTARWSRERDACCADVLARGYYAQRGAFRMAYDLDDLDAANMLMPVLGFLPADDPRVASNLDRTLRELFVDDLCYRYRRDDDLRGEEGAFLACSFWAVEALILRGDVAQARSLFDRLAARATPLGLWSEQIDPRTGAYLGNLPQAFSHVAFHDAALRLAVAEGRRVPVSPDPAGIGAPAGSRGHAGRADAAERNTGIPGAARRDTQGVSP